MNFYTKLMKEFLHDNGCKLIRDKNGCIRLRRWDIQEIEPEHCPFIGNGNDLVIWLEKPINRVTSYLAEAADEWGFVRPFDLMITVYNRFMPEDNTAVCYYVRDDDPEYWAELDRETDMRSPDYKFFDEYKDLIDICYMISTHAYQIDVEQLVEE